jgi:hypothetical protein
MRQPMIDDFVRLTGDIPELALTRGEIGVVRGKLMTTIKPRESLRSVAYEVEFHQVGHDYQTRALLMPQQLVVEDGSLLAAV